MSNGKIFGAMLALLLTLPPAVSAAPAWQMDLNRTGDEKAPGGALLPDGWEITGKKLRVPVTDFKIVTDPATGKKALQVICHKSTGGVVFATPFDPHKTPILRWRWRVLSLPAGADGRDEKKDDQAIAIYVGMESGLKKKSIAYRWETETPVGHQGKASYGGGIVQVIYLVLRNQETPCGEWVEEERNLAEDFQKLYGKIPEEAAISILGNSQYTGTDAVAEIEFIGLFAVP